METLGFEAEKRGSNMSLFSFASSSAATEKPVPAEPPKQTQTTFSEPKKFHFSADFSRKGGVFEFTPELVVLGTTGTTTTTTPSAGPNDLPFVFGSSAKTKSPRSRRRSKVPRMEHEVASMNITIPLESEEGKELGFGSSEEEEEQEGKEMEK